MAKRTIRKLWIWGLAVMTAGGLFVTASSIGFALHAKNLPGNETDALFWVMISLIVASSVVGGVGLILQTVAWVGAIVNARRLPDRSWYRALLGTGLTGLIIGMVTLPVAAVTGSPVVMWVGYPLAGLIGWAVMIPYLVAGPGEAPPEQPLVAAPARTPGKLIPTG